MDVAVYSTFTLRELAGLSIDPLSATGTVRRLQGETEYDTILYTFLSEEGIPGVIEASFTYGSSDAYIELGRYTGTLDAYRSHYAECTRAPASRKLVSQAARDRRASGA